MTAPDPLPNAFARLDPRGGWRSFGGAPGLVFAPDGVRLGERIRAIADHEPAGSFGGRSLPRGVAIADDGTMFVADPEGRRVLVLLPAWGMMPRPADADSIWPLRALWTRPAADPSESAGDPYALVCPTDAAITPDGDLAIVDPGAGRIVVLVLPSAAIRRVITLEGAPTAIGFDALRRAYVALADQARVVRLNSDWTIDEGYRGGAGVLTSPAAIAVIAGTSCACGDACGCGPVSGALPDGTAFVLDGVRVQALDPGGYAIDTPLPDTLSSPPLVVDGFGAVTRPLPPREPLRLPGVTVDRRGRIGGVMLVARPRRIVLPKAASWIVGPFDGERDSFAWDRVLIDAGLPERSRIVVDAFTSDPLLEAVRIDALPPDSWSRALSIERGDYPEILLQAARGRYLWLRLQLFGDGEATPTIRAIEIGGPRASSLRYLPAPYHQDPESAAFLDRLLALFDTMLDGPAAVGRGFPAFVDPDAVPTGGFLDWLGAWFDWRFLAQWPDDVRREMIREAIPFFRERGTAAGLRRLIQWHSGVADPWPGIVEHFRLRDRAAAQPLFLAGLPLAPAAADCAHAFTLVMPVAAVPDQAMFTRLIEAQKPAHTTVSLRLVAPGFRIGRQSSIGIDSLIGTAPIAPLGHGHLAQSLVTGSHASPVIGAAYLASSGG